ncbi:MAG TPA: M28 family peptidase [Pyrinomonadaceae bacterium]|nr:M28 family peptidase [Pyrinomonadaceae bacterium]
MRRLQRAAFALVVGVLVLGPALGQESAVRPEWRAALERVTAGSMKGHLSFIASDALEGRETPSRGLDLAAEYIAAQFRRAGLEPAGDDGYFQTANWAEVSADAPRPVKPPVAPAVVRNVAGVLRGSDPNLRDTYVIVSAHYDHVGVLADCAAGDCIHNGANDDGSGTVAVMEMAAALGRLERKPRRSILFLAFFGEEWGLVGSRHYGRRPLVPLAKTVAQINLEQVGRTDDSEGPRLSAAAVTGFDYSEVGETLRRAGAAAGVRLFKHPTKSDAFFSRSDNQALADLGVPAHTVGVAFEFPDYHGVGDHWEKIDYANMERVVRAVALGLLALADDPRAPRWDESNPRAAKYAQAWKKLHGR